MERGSWATYRDRRTSKRSAYVAEIRHKGGAVSGDIFDRWLRVTTSSQTWVDPTYHIFIFIFYDLLYKF